MVFDRVLVELSGVDVYQTLSVAAKKGIVFRDVKSIDALSCRLWVPGSAINTLRNLSSLRILNFTLINLCAQPLSHCPTAAIEYK